MPRAHTIVDPESILASGRRWDWVILALLAALLAFAPAAFGAVEAWSELVVVLLAAAVAVCLALRLLFDAEFRIASTWLYLPLGLFVALVTLQLVSLPAGLAALFSPATLATKQELLGETINHTSLSFYPHATAEHLRLVLVGTAVFVAVASVVRYKQQVKMLLLAVFAIGCAQAALAVAQIATLTDSIYWSVPTGKPLATAGTFINYSNFSQFMNLSLGAGVALLLIRLHEQRRREIHGATWHYSFAGVNWEKYGWLVCGIVLCAISVFTSMSRNGAISLVVAATIVGAALYRRGTLNWRGWLLGAIPLAVLAVLLVFGFDAVYERLSTLQDTTAYESRWEMTAATLRAWSHYPVWGTGLGTHEFVFPMFDTSASRVVAGHADNDYAQLVEEMGGVGATFVAAFLIGIAMVTFKLATRGRSSVAAASFGLAFGLIAVAIHSASDFGQRLPANLALSATFCGLLVAMTRIERRDRQARRGSLPDDLPTTTRFRRVAAFAALTVLAAVSTWALRDAYAAYIGERWWAAALALESHLQESPDQATDQHYMELIDAAQNAFESDPTNVQYGYWLNSYRWEPLSRAVDPDTGQVVLHPEVLPFVQRIADELTAVRRICPTYGPPYALEGQLRLFVLNDSSGAELIRKGVRLAAYDPPTCLVAGELAAREGQINQAQQLLSRAVALYPPYFRDAADIYFSQLNRPDLAKALAGDDYRRLEELARMAAQSEQHAELADEFRAAAVASLRRRAADPDATAQELSALARIDQAEGQLDSAIDLYRRALGHEYRQVAWRLELARALAASNQIDQALHEVRICLRLRAQYEPAMRLLNELIARKEAAGN